MGNTFGTLALILGIIGLCPLFGAFLGPLAIILGAVGIKRDNDTSLAIVGLVLGIITALCGIIFLIWFLAILFA